MGPLFLGCGHRRAARLLQRGRRDHVGASAHRLLCGDHRLSRLLPAGGREGVKR